MVTSEQRRRQLAREKYERQVQARAQAAAQRKKRNAIVAAVLAVVVVAGVATVASGVFSSDKKDDKAAATPAKPAGKKWDAEPAMTIDTKAAYTATVDTSAGKVSFTLDAAKAPHTVNSFVFLAGQQFWDNTKCHRLTTEGIYVLQCGDPTGTGSGGPGYKFADENLEGATYPAGTVAMANAGPGTNGSQFFLVYKDTQLPPSYTPFGKITAGLDVLQKIADAGTQSGTGDGAPKTPVNVKSITTAQG